MSDKPQGVFIDDVEFPFDDSSSILAFTDKALGEKIIPTLCNDAVSHTHLTLPTQA